MKVLVLLMKFHQKGCKTLVKAASSLENQDKGYWRSAI